MNKQKNKILCYLNNNYNQYNNKNKNHSHNNNNNHNHKNNSISHNNNKTKIIRKLLKQFPIKNKIFKQIIVRFLKIKIKNKKLILSMNK